MRKLRKVFNLWVRVCFPIQYKLSQEFSCAYYLVYQLTAEEEKLLERKKSALKKAIESTSELENLLKSIRLNEVLLKTFLKYIRFAELTSFESLTRQVEKNIAEESDIREQEIERWRKKRLRLQKLDPHLDLTFRQTFLTKNQVMDHQVYQIIKSKLL